MFDPSLGRWLTMDPEGFAAGDANLYRTEGNDPISQTDPTGLQAKDVGAKPITDADLAAILEKNPAFITFMEAAAKGTDKLERWGFILKAVDPKAKPQYKIVECTSAETTQTHSKLYWLEVGGNKVLPPVEEGKIIDCDKLKDTKPDRNYYIVAWWHSHPPLPVGDGTPSAGDQNTSHDKNLPGIMIQYVPRMEGEKIIPQYNLYIIDTDGMEGGYKEYPRDYKKK